MILYLYFTLKKKGSNVKYKRFFSNKLIKLICFSLKVEGIINKTNI